jgi:threonine aldolase
MSRFSVDLDSVETNILIFKVTNGNVSGVIQQLESRDILMVPFGPDTIRATFHHEVGDDDLEITIMAFQELFR